MRKDTTKKVYINTENITQVLKWFSAKLNLEFQHIIYGI